MKKTILGIFCCFCLLFLTKTSAQTIANLQFAGHLDMAAYRGFDGSYDIVCNDVEGYVASNGTEYAVVGTHKGIAIVDVSNAAAPVQRDFVMGGIGTTWREIAIYSHYAYCVTDGREQLGVLIIDLANLPAAVTSQYWIPQIPNGGGFSSLTKSHTIVIEDGFMYLNGYNALEQQTAFFDLRQTPLSPTYAGMVNDEYCHDSYVRHDTLYTADIYQGRVRMYDVSNKANPVSIGTPFNTPFNFTHQVWQSNDGNYLFTTDERPDAPVAAYNINNVNNVTEVCQFLRYETIGQGSVSHNLYVVPNDYLVIANYTDGVTIVDVRHPDNMVEVANYDTYPGSTPNPPYSGVWAVYPFLPSGKMLVSDMASGFYTLTPSYARASWLEGTVTDGVCGGSINNAKITIVNNNTDIAGSSSKISGVYKTGYKAPGTYTIRVEKAGYVTQTVPVTLVQGQIVTKNIVLLPVGTVNLAQTITDANSNPLSQVKLKITNTTATYNGATQANGQSNFNCVFTGTYDVWAGKWGYETKQTSNTVVSSTTTSLPNISLNQGYIDPFELDLGWTINSNSPNGVSFQREEMNNFAGNAATDGTDIGKSCYVTHSGGTTIDNGTASLLSPAMNLAGFTDVVLRFNCRMYAPSGLGTMYFYLVTPSQTVVIDSIVPGTSAWRAKTLHLQNYITLTNNMQFKVSVVSPQAGAQIEAAFDNFNITRITNTENAVENLPFIAAQPNPFNDVCKLQIDNIADLGNNSFCLVYNSVGQLVEKQEIKVANAGNTLEIGQNLPKGAYFVNIISNNKIVSRAKIIKI